MTGTAQSGIRRANLSGSAPTSNDPEYSKFTCFISTEKMAISRALIIHVEFNYNLFRLLSDYRIMVGTEIKTVQLSLFSMLPYLEDIVMYVYNMTIDTKKAGLWFVKISGQLHYTTVALCLESTVD